MIFQKCTKGFDSLKDLALFLLNTLSKGDENMKNVYRIKGLILGIILSFITALLFMLLGQIWAGGITSFWGESWLYFSVIIPFTITYAVLGGYFHNRNELPNIKWVNVE